MSSTLARMADMVVTELGGTGATAGEINNPTIEIQQIKDSFALVQEDAWSRNDWSFSYDSFTMSNTASNRTMILSSVTNIDFMKPLRKVRDTTNNLNLKEISKRQWNVQTAYTASGVPFYYRRFGYATSTAGLVIPKIQLDPRPSAARSYEIEHPTTPPSLSADTSRSPFPDALLVNGVLARMSHYDGFDWKTFAANYENILEILIGNEDANIDYKIGGGVSVSIDERLGPQLPPEYPARYE